MMILILLVVLIAGFACGRLGWLAVLAPVESEIVIDTLYAMVFAISIGIGAQYRNGEGERLSFQALLYSAVRKWLPSAEPLRSSPALPALR